MKTKRLYYDDSFTREFSANVARCEPATHGSQPAWAVVLDSTAFYPTSGGQPFDVGKLGGAQVLDVRDEGEEIKHIVDRPLEAGAVQGAIDWRRRFDHMQQHTGQHLLSAILQERFKLPTVSVHFGDDTSTLDVRGAEPSDDILQAAQRAANQIIFEDRPVNIHFGTAEELAQKGIRKEVDREGVLRAIEIAGTDFTPCGGTHVARTGQIGTLLIRRLSKVRQDWRVEFVCGERAERVAGDDFRALRQCAERLGGAMEDVVSSVERLIAERDAQFKASKALLQKLADADAGLLLQQVLAGPDGTRVIARAFSEDAQPEYINSLASQLAKSERTVALFSRDACGHLVFAQHPSAGKDMNTLLKQVLQQLGGKGGGSKESARGKLSDPSLAQKAIELAKQLL